MTNQIGKYPKYFLIDDDVYVKLYLVGESEIAGINHWGNPYPPGKAIVDGQPISRATFEKGVLNRQGLPIPSRSRAAASASA